MKFKQLIVLLTSIIFLFISTSCNKDKKDNVEEKVKVESNANKKVAKNMVKKEEKKIPRKEKIALKKGMQSVNGKVALFVPEGWKKQATKDMWIDQKTFSSVNVITENAAAYKLDPYLDLSLTNMKKSIATYKLIKRSKKTVNGNEIGMLLGEFTMSKMDIKLYSVVLDLNGMKYVFSIGGPKKTFDSLDATFNKIIDSITKL